MFSIVVCACYYDSVLKIKMVNIKITKCQIAHVTCMTFQNVDRVYASLLDSDIKVLTLEIFDANSYLLSVVGGRECSLHH